MDAAILGRIPLFQSLDQPDIDHLLDALRTRQVEAGTILIQEGLTDECFYILLQGKVEIIKALGSVDERILAVRERDLLGEMGLFSQDGKHTASVRALTPLLLAEMSRSEFDDLLRKHPQMAYQLVGRLTQRLDESENLTIADLQEKNRQLQKAYDELRAAQAQIIAKEKLDRELEIARKIQFSILPDSLPSYEGCDLAALMVPARAVGGDFFDFMELDEEHLALVIGDVTDKGVPAALFMALTYSLIRAEAALGVSPRQTLKNINLHLLDMNVAGMFVTLLYGILHVRTGVMHYARAGHPLPLLMDDHGHALKVPAGSGQPLGLFEGISIDEQVVTIPPAGMMLLYSDGLNEATDREGHFFGDGRMRYALAAAFQQPAGDICDLLWHEVRKFCGSAGQTDDFTVVVVKREG